jgi:predicted kinase
MCKGLPASGKSTYSKKYAVDNPTTVLRVCRDDIRNMFGKYWVPEREGIVTSLEWKAITAGLRDGYSVIVDATNLSAKTEKNFRAFAAEHGAEFEIMDFTHVPLEVCIQRDAERTVGYVGEEVIKSFYERYLKNRDNIKA